MSGNGSDTPPEHAPSENGNLHGSDVPGDFPAATEPISTDGAASAPAPASSGSDSKNESGKPQKDRTKWCPECKWNGQGGLDRHLSTHDKKLYKCPFAKDSEDANGEITGCRTI